MQCYHGSHLLPPEPKLYLFESCSDAVARASCLCVSLFIIHGLRNQRGRPRLQPNCVRSASPPSPNPSTPESAPPSPTLTRRTPAWKPSTYLLFAAALVFFCRPGSSCFAPAQSVRRMSRTSSFKNIIDSCGGVIGLWSVGYVKGSACCLLAIPILLGTPCHFSAIDRE